MAVSEEYRGYVQDLLSAYGNVQIRRMFGAAGIFQNDLMFGLIADDQIYLKADDINRAEFEAAGCAPFVYERSNGRTAEMSYYLIPDALYDDADELAQWARNAFAAALRGAQKKPAKRRSRK